MKKGLKSLWGLLIAIAVTAFSAQAQDVVSQACAPVNQDAPAPVVKAAKVEGTATYQAGIATQFTPVTDFKAAAAEKASSSKRAKQAPAKVASVKALEGEYVLTGKSMLTSGYNGYRSLWLLWEPTPLPSPTSGQRATALYSRRKLTLPLVLSSYLIR